MVNVSACSDAETSVYVASVFCWAIFMHCRNPYVTNICICCFCHSLQQLSTGFVSIRRVQRCAVARSSFGEKKASQATLVVNSDSVEVSLRHWGTMAKLMQIFA